MHHTIWINAWEKKTKKEHTKTHFSCPLQLLLIPCGKFNAYNTFFLLLDSCNPCMSLANYKLKRLNGKLSCMLFSIVHDYRYKSRHLAIDFKLFFFMMDGTNSSTVGWNKTNNFPSEICILVQSSTKTDIR